MSKTLHKKAHLCSHDPAHDDEEKEVHLVMVPYPLQGHINPMMQLAKVLVAKHAGVRVTFVNNKHNHDRIQYTRCSALTHAKMPSLPSPNISPQQQDSKFQFSWVENGLPSDFDYTDLIPVRMFDFHMAAYNMKEPFKQLLQNLNQKESPVSCVLFGSFCPWVHSVAADLGIPSIFFWTQSTSVFSIYYHAHLLAANGFFPYNKKVLPGCSEDGSMPYSTSDQLVSYIPGVPPLHPSSFPTLLHIDSISNPSLATIREQFEILQTCDGVIVNSFEELEKEAYQALRAELPCPLSLVGPLIPSAYLDGCDINDTSIGASLLQEKSECIQWLDSQKRQSVLYVSFGSVCNISAEDLQGIANGIKKQKQPFTQRG